MIFFKVRILFAHLIHRLSPGRFNLNENGKFVGITKNPETFMPVYHTVENDNLYIYDYYFTSFGVDLIYMHCSGKSDGCSAKLTIIPKRNIVKKDTTHSVRSVLFAMKNTSCTEFINPDSKDNLELKNYKSTWKSKNLKFHTPANVHTCRMSTQGNKF